MSSKALLLLAACVIATLDGANAAAVSPNGQSTDLEFAATTGMPRDATARCVDGTWSSSEHRKGSCSGHGGMRKWFGKPPKNATFRCKDGTYSKAKESRGACSKHGGILFELPR